MQILNHKIFKTPHPIDEFGLCVHYGLVFSGQAHNYVYIYDSLQLYIAANWGEPERAPHKREVRAVGLSVVLSVRS